MCVSLSKSCPSTNMNLSPWGFRAEPLSEWRQIIDLQFRALLHVCLICLVLCLLVSWFCFSSGKTIAVYIRYCYRHPQLINIKGQINQTTSRTRTNHLRQMESMTKPLRRTEAGLYSNSIKQLTRRNSFKQMWWLRVSQLMLHRLISTKDTTVYCLTVFSIYSDCVEDVWTHPLLLGNWLITETFE